MSADPDLFPVPDRDAFRFDAESVIRRARIREDLLDAAIRAADLDDVVTALWARPRRARWSRAARAEERAAVEAGGAALGEVFRLAAEYRDACQS